MLERIHDNRALNDKPEGAEFLRESALKGRVVRYSYCDVRYSGDNPGLRLPFPFSREIGSLSAYMKIAIGIHWKKRGDAGSCWGCVYSVWSDLWGANPDDGFNKRI